MSPAPAIARAAASTAASAVASGDASAGVSELLALGSPIRAAYPLPFVPSGPTARAIRQVRAGYSPWHRAVMTQTAHAVGAYGDRAVASEEAGPIVLATEFGAVSSAAELVAIRMASEAGVSLVIVHAIDPGRLRLSGGRFRLRIDQARAARESDTQAIVRRVAAGGVRPHVLIWEGDPATCVVEAARAESASESSSVRMVVAASDAPSSVASLPTSPLAPDAPSTSSAVMVTGSGSRARHGLSRHRTTRVIPRR